MRPANPMIKMMIGLALLSGLCVVGCKEDPDPPPSRPPGPTPVTPPAPQTPPPVPQT